MKIVLISPEEITLNAQHAQPIHLKAGVEHEFKCKADYEPFKEHIKGFVKVGHMKITRHEFVAKEVLHTMPVKDEKSAEEVKEEGKKEKKEKKEKVAE